ncbi:hypothetical protein [Acinetobacter sp. BSP-53]|uniref:hypothetical protein n=1 Tax=Acinetobacter sp. BSP-53 TaxID=3344662 RepID=UPI00376F532E
MGGSSSQVTGYRYFTNLLLFIGNPIEKMLGINFDKRGWLSPFVDENSNALAQGVINSPSLFGENEGGVAGVVHVQYGTDNQDVLPFYKDYMESIGLRASAYPYQSYLAFTGLGSVKLDGLAGGVFNTLMPYNNAFYVGNSGYMKEMLLWPKRTRIRNDGRRQWYEVRGDGAVVCEIGSRQIISNTTQSKIHNAIFTYKTGVTTGNNEVNYSVVRNEQSLEFEQSRVAISMGGATTSINDEEEKIKVGYKLDFSPISKIKIIIETSRIGSESVTIIGNILSYEKKIKSRNELTYEYVIEAGHFEFIFTVSAFNSVSAFIEYVTIESYPFGYIANNEYPDINPIHKIREILTDDTAMNKPESSVNDDNFIKAADQIFDEGLGVSWSITEKSCIDAINELCYHIEAGIRVNRQTGLYEMVLFRDDWFEEDEIHTIAESKIKKGSMQYEITNADEVINQVNVNYYDRKNIKNSSFSISESGLIQTLGRVNAETVDFPYFMNMRNAEIVANWKLKILSTGVLKGSFTTGWREARKWNRYDLIRLPWSKRWTGTILVRIMSIKLGGPTSNEVSIEWVEVVPSTGMMNTTIVADDPIEKPLPPQPIHYEPFEMPYYLAVMALGQRQVEDELAYESNFGLVGVVAERPQSNSLYAVMMTNNYDEWVRAGSIQYSETADSDQFISRTATSFTVKNWKKIANFPVGTLIQCGKEWLTGYFEWMVFQGIDPETGVMSVKRGALDTQPQDWDFDLKLYFCGTDVAYDATEYVAGEKVLVSALTTTPSGVLELKGSHSVEMKARAIRPYPPANVKINDVYFPETLIVTNNIVLTWVHRNRAQQTGGVILGWYDGDVTVEDGVTYSYELVCENVILDSRSNISANTVTILASVLKPNKPHKLKLWSVRDGYESYQKFEHSFFIESVSLLLTATALKDKVTGNTVPVANISVSIDESLKANMKFDGSSISGKAPAGATITIEVDE